MILNVAFFIAYFLISKTVDLKDVLSKALPFRCYACDSLKASAAPLSPLQKSENKRTTLKGGFNLLILQLKIGGPCWA